MFIEEQQRTGIHNRWPNGRQLYKFPEKKETKSLLYTKLGEAIINKEFFLLASEGMRTSPTGPPNSNRFCPLILTKGKYFEYSEYFEVRNSKNPRVHTVCQREEPIGLLGKFLQ